MNQKQSRLPSGQSVFKPSQKPNSSVAPDSRARRRYFQSTSEVSKCRSSSRGQLLPTNSTRRPIRQSIPAYHAGRRRHVSQTLGLAISHGNTMKHSFKCFLMENDSRLLGGPPCQYKRSNGFRFPRHADPNVRVSHNVAPLVTRWAYRHTPGTHRPQNRGWKAASIHPIFPLEEAVAGLVHRAAGFRFVIRGSGVRIPPPAP